MMLELIEGVPRHRRINWIQPPMAHGTTDTVEYEKAGGSYAGMGAMGKEPNLDDSIRGDRQADGLEEILGSKESGAAPTRGWHQAAAS